MKWLIYKRGTIHPYRADMLLRGIFKYSEKLVGQFTSSLYINQGPNLWWTWNKIQLKKAFNIIIKKCRSSKFFLKHFKELEEYARNVEKVTKNMREINLKEISDKELYEKYNHLDKVCIPAMGVLMVDIDAIDIFLEEFLIEKLNFFINNNVSSEEILKLYKELFKTTHQTYINKQEEMIIRIALKKKIGDSDIDNLYKKFWWTNLGWENAKLYNKKYFLNQILIYKKKKNLKQSLNQIVSQSEKLKKNRQEIINQYKLNKEINHWLNVVDRYSFLHDKRKEAQVKSMHAYYLLMYETARRLKLKFTDLEWLWHSELKALLVDGKFDIKEVVRRKRAVAALIEKKRISFVSGHLAENLYKKELNVKHNEVKIFKGMGVCLGKVRAKVKVCAGAKESLQKIKKGDILVCSMTLPDYVPAMKKASAIITDEGGITCHAAIISRELNIPCIVGTKIATEVLKDGDLVEVDADKGVVKILKK